jgi:hypothetical protein
MIVTIQIAKTEVHDAGLEGGVPAELRRSFSAAGDAGVRAGDVIAEVDGGQQRRHDGARLGIATIARSPPPLPATDDGAELPRSRRRGERDLACAAQRYPRATGQLSERRG